VGKSTELAKLAQALSDKFDGLTPPIDRHLGLEVMDWQDIVVCSALHLASELFGRGRADPGLFHSSVKGLYGLVRKDGYLEVVLKGIPNVCQKA